MTPSVSDQDRVRALLECVAIKRVISVDDNHSPGLGVVLTLARDLSGEQRAELLEQPEDAEPFDELELFEQHLDGLWDELRPDERTKLVQLAQRMADQSDVADDTVALHQLAQLMPDGTFERLSLSEWKAKRAEVLGSDDGTLVLFDRDFSGEGAREDEGEELVADLQQASQDKPIWTGLLTHTVTAKQEHEAYLGLSERLDLHRTIVISKERIAAGTLPAHLRLTLLAPLMRRLVEIVSEQIASTQEAARSEALTVLPVELETMVFGASQVEGVWEADTLLLLFGLIQRDRARESIWETDEVHSLTRKIRCLSQADTGQPVADADADARGHEDDGAASDVPRFFQRRQIYEDGAVVSKLRLPIECGDIFMDSARTSKKWIVIAQPCDLMVRSNGRRGPYPITHVVMAPVERERKADDVQAGDFRLPYFDEQGRPYLVKLSRARHQRVWLLDLAVFRDDGRAVLSVDGSPGENMLDGWGARHTRLVEKVRDILQVCTSDADELVKALASGSPSTGDGEALAASLRDSALNDHARSPFAAKIDPVAGSLDAGCQRVERLSADYARALLARWGGHVARPVLPYDLTRQPN